MFHAGSHQADVLSGWQAGATSGAAHGSDGSRSGTGAKCAAAPAAALAPCCSPLSIRGIASDRPLSRLLPLLGAGWAWRWRQQVVSAHELV